MNRQFYNDILGIIIFIVIMAFVLLLLIWFMQIIHPIFMSLERYQLTILVVMPIILIVIGYVYSFRQEIRNFVKVLKKRWTD